MAAENDLRRLRVLREDDPGSSPRRMWRPARAGTVVGVLRLRELNSRVRALDPARADLALTALFSVALVIELSLVDAHGESRLLSIAVGLFLVSWIAVRRRSPLAAALGLALSLVLAGIVPDQFVLDNASVPFVAFLFLLYSTGRHGSGRDLRIAVPVVLLCLLVGVALSDEGLDPADIIWIFLLFGLPFVAGRALRSRALLQRELREKAERAEAERELFAARAIEDERARIAAELQAVVANGVSAMVVQAEAVPRLVSAGDTPRAGEALAVIETTGRDALAEMRRLLGVLRRDGASRELAPQPGLARMAPLLARVRERGMLVELEVSGPERPLPAGVDLTAYRVLEDALEAALEKEASSALVALRYDGPELELEIRDDRAGGPSDRLPGLRERVALYGGSLRAGKPGSGGFRLTARLPLGDAH